MAPVTKAEQNMLDDFRDRVKTLETEMGRVSTKQSVHEEVCAERQKLIKLRLDWTLIALGGLIALQLLGTKESILFLLGKH